MTRDSHPHPGHVLDGELQLLVVPGEAVHLQGDQKEQEQAGEGGWGPRQAGHRHDSPV